MYPSHAVLAKFCYHKGSRKVLRWLEIAPRVSLRSGALWQRNLAPRPPPRERLPMLLVLTLGLLPGNQPPRGTIGRAERSKRRAVGDETVFDITNRFDGFFALLDALRRSGLRTEIKPGDAVIPTKDLEAQNIIAAQSYELQSVWYQGVDGAEVERCPVDSLNSRAPPGKESYIKYCSLFNENYHEGGPVIVRPEEVGLTSVADEIGESVKIAVPILAFWITVSSAFVVYGQLTS
jgi:hypothetical protein